ncbi:MAG: hypothetical protein RLY27_22 [Pseudomonadota bacterium]|jgi:hypothetical protein
MYDTQMINRIFLENKLPARALLGIVFLIISILGTHWVGLTHAIEHAEFNKEHAYHVSDQEGMNTAVDLEEHPNSLLTATESDSNPHTNSICTIFNAISLASFVSCSDLPSSYVQFIPQAFDQVSYFFELQVVQSPYQPRAPPFHTL